MKAPSPLLMALPVLAVTLGACVPGPYVPFSPDNQIVLTFPEDVTLPGGGDLRAGLVWYDPAGAPHSEAVSSVYASPGGSLNLYFTERTALQNSAAFVTPFVGGETQDKTEVSVSAPDVRTGNLYPVVWRDANGNNKFESTETIVLKSHDLLSYATADFNYAFTVSRGAESSRETGVRRAGWSRVRHLVYSPTATPGRTIVQMDSVEDRTFRLNDTTDYYTSMGRPAVDAGAPKGASK